MTARGEGTLSKEERLERIYRAGAALFARHGYHGATVADIAAEADLTKPAVYRHFESKQELYMALLERHRDGLATAGLDPLLRQRPLSLEAIPAMAESWLTYVESHPDGCRLLLGGRTGDADIDALQDELRGRQRAADVALLRELAPHIPEPELLPLGELIRASLTTMGLWWLDHPNTPRQSVLDAAVRLCRGIAEPGELTARNQAV